MRAKVNKPKNKNELASPTVSKGEILRDSLVSNFLGSRVIETLSAMCKIAAKPLS